MSESSWSDDFKEQQQQQNDSLQQLISLRKWMLHQEEKRKAMRNPRKNKKLHRDVLAQIEVILKICHDFEN